MYRLLFLILLRLTLSVCNGTEYLPYSNKTDNRFISKTERFKRAPSNVLQHKVEAMIIDESGNYIHLNWVQTDQYLANVNLPVWIASKYQNKASPEHGSESNMMKEFGAFVMYQDIEKNSAVVYFEETNSIHGIIDTRYIVNIPIRLLNKCHKVGSKYVTKHVTQCHGDHTYPQPSLNIIRTFNDCDLDEKSIVKNKNKPVMDTNICQSVYPPALPDYERIDNYFVEILVFVAYDIVEHFQIIHPDIYLSEIVTDYIILFNVVDMVFAKLKKHKINIHLNLAGIVIEDQKDIFSSIFNNPDLKYEAKGRILETHTMDSGIEGHLQNKHSPFTIDSVDYVFFMTSRKIKMRDSHVGGLTFHGQDIFSMRQKGKIFRGLPITIMQHTQNYDQYYTAAHEIGHSFELSHDGLNDGVLRGRSQCYAVMQQYASFCPQCVDWSQKSVNELKIFLRENRNRCFLLNPPRSLESNVPRTFLTPCRQCHCYGFEIMDRDSCPMRVLPYNCRTPILCLKPRPFPSIYIPTILPFDGTSCGKNRVCWENKCVPVQ